MKLLLADGKEIALAGWANTTAIVNCNTVPAVNLVILGQTVDTVKSLFGNEANTGTMTIYDNSNKIEAQLVGYQVRSNINIASDNGLSVTMAKTCEMKMLVEALESAALKSVDASTENTAKIDKIVKAMENQAKAINDCNTNYQEITSVLADLGKNITGITDTIAYLVEAQVSYKGNLESIGVTNSGLADTVASVVEVTKEIQEALAETNDFSAKAVNDVIALQQAIEAQNKAIAIYDQNYNETRSLVTKNDAKVLDALTNVRSYKESFEASTKSVSEELERINKTNFEIESREAEIKVMMEGIAEKSSETDNVLHDIAETNEVIKNDLEKKTESLKQVEEEASKTSKAVTELSETAKNIDTVSKENAKNISELSKQTAKVGEDVGVITQKAESLDKRLVAIEPILDYTTLPLDQAKKFRVEESQMALAAFLADNPIISSCHGGKPALYSITKEKQAYLQSMIGTAQIALANGIEYKPSWNATGEACTYDWTLEELQILAMQIETVVRPLVSKQQMIEKEIIAAKTMEALSAVTITYADVDINKINPTIIFAENSTVEDTEDTTVGNTDETEVEEG